MYQQFYNEDFNGNIKKIVLLKLIYVFKKLAGIKILVAVFYLKAEFSNLRIPWSKMKKTVLACVYSYFEFGAL